MSAPFEPIGELARWRVLVGEFAAVARGTTLTYEQLGKVLDLDPARDRKAISAAVGQASKTLSRDHERSLIAVRNVGYRVALPDEHIDLATRHQRKAGRQLARGKSHVENADYSGMSDEGRSLAVAMTRAFIWQQTQMRRMDVRQKDLERVVESITTRVERTEGEHAARLAEIERKIAERFGE